jgi:hypothetical protein
VAKRSPSLLVQPTRQSGAQAMTSHLVGANTSVFFLLIFLIQFAIVFTPSRRHFASTPVP